MHPVRTSTFPQHFLIQTIVCETQTFTPVTFYSNNGQKTKECPPFREECPSTILILSKIIPISSIVQNITIFTLKLAKCGPFCRTICHSTTNECHAFLLKVFYFHRYKCKYTRASRTSSNHSTYVGLLLFKQRICSKSNFMFDQSVSQSPLVQFR